MSRLCPPPQLHLHPTPAHFRYCSNFVRAFSRSIWWWHDACATTAMQARAPARTPPQVSSLVIRDDSRLECLIVFVPSRATTTVSAVNPCALRATTMLARDAKPRLVASARNPCNSHVRPFNSEPQSTGGINNGPKPLKRAFVVGRLRRFALAIAITAAAITSPAAVDSPEISLMNTLLLWDEGGIAFGDLTFWNRPLLGTATAIVVDCQFLDRDGQKVDQRKLTVEGPVYGRTIKTVRVRIGTLSGNAETMACSVVDFKWVSWQQ